MSETALNTEYLDEVNRSAGFESKSFIHTVPHLHDLLLMRKRVAVHLNTVPDETTKIVTDEQYNYINNEIKKLLNL